MSKEKMRVFWMKIFDLIAHLLIRIYKKHENGHAWDVMYKDIHVDIRREVDATFPKEAKSLMNKYQKRYLEGAKKEIPEIIKMLDDEVKRRESPYADGLRIRLGQTIVLLKHYGGDLEWN
jgi:hypothetical protein